MTAFETIAWRELCCDMQMSFDLFPCASIIILLRFNFDCEFILSLWWRIVATLNWRRNIDSILRIIRGRTGCLLFILDSFKAHEVDKKKGDKEDKKNAMKDYPLSATSFTTI